MGESSRRSRSKDQTIQELRRRIIDGTYPAHSYLPAERDLARELGLSRWSVSAALTALKQEGWIEQTRGRGTMVLPYRKRLAERPVGIIYPPFSPTSPASIIVFEAMVILDGIKDTLARIDCPYDLIPWTQCPSVEDLAAKYRGAVFIEAQRPVDYFAEAARRKVATVVANLETDLAVSCSWVNHRRSTKLAVQLLLAMGHRRIAFVGRSPERYFYGMARQGYLDALAEAGVPVDGDLVLTASPDPGPFASYYPAKELFSAGARVTAVVAARDVLAEGVCQAAAESGRVVGRDLSVIGFDNCSWPQTEPFLTTFEEPCYRMGQEAVKILIEQIASGDLGVVKREVPAPLVLRRSAGPVVQDNGDGGPPRHPIPRSLEIRDLCTRWISNAP